MPLTDELLGDSRLGPSWAIGTLEEDREEAIARDDGHGAVRNTGIRVSEEQYRNSLEARGTMRSKTIEVNRLLNARKARLRFGFIPARQSQ